MITGTRKGLNPKASGQVVAVYRVTASTEEELSAYKDSQEQLVEEDDGTPLFFSSATCDSVVEIRISQKGRAYVHDETELALRQMQAAARNRDKAFKTNEAETVTNTIVSLKVQQLLASKKLVNPVGSKQIDPGADTGAGTDTEAQAAAEAAAIGG